MKTITTWTVGVALASFNLVLPGWTDDRQAAIARAEEARAGA